MSYNPYFSGSVPNDQDAADRLAKMYDAAGSARAREIANKYKIDKASLEQQYKIALMESGDRRAAIEATREYQRGQLEQARQEMLQVSIPKVQVEQFLAQANTEIARGELQAKQYMYQGDVAYKQGTLQQARDEMLQMGIPKVLIDQFVAQSNAAYQRGELGLKREEMERLGIPKMLTDRYSAEAQAAYQQATARTGQYGAEAQAAYQQGQLGLTAQQQAQQAVEQQRRYALDVAKYGTELASTPDRYFQAQQFAAMAPRLLGLQAGAGPEGGPTPGINQMGSLLAQATEGMQNAAPAYQLPQFPNAPGPMPAFPTMPGYTDPGGSPFPQFPTMAPYTPPPLGPMPTFPTAQFGPMAPITTPWGATVPGYPGSSAPATPPPSPFPGQSPAPAGGVPDGGIKGVGPGTGSWTTDANGQWRPVDMWRPAMNSGASGNAMSLAPDGSMQPYGAGYGSGSGGEPIRGINPVGPDPYAAYGGAAGYKGGGGGGYGGPLTGGAGDQSYLAGQSGQQYGQPSYPTGTGTYGGPTAGATPTYTGGAANQNLSALQPDEQGRYHQLTARRAQLQRAGSMAGWSPEDEAELGRYEARLRAPSGYGSTDPRMKQVAQIAKASPPSPYDGLNESDAATLKLMEAIYKRGGRGAAGGEMERLDEDQRGFMSSAGKLLGYSPKAYEHEYQMYRPSQGSASLAG